MKIKNREISLRKPPFIIAEISANHNKSIERTLKLIDEAKKAGADAVKLQTYTAQDMTLNSNKKEFIISDKNSLWYKKKLFDLYNKGSLPIKWYRDIFNRAKKNNIICFSTPFSENSVDILNNFNVPAFKIASFENTHYPLIYKVIKSKKPIIISLGVSKLNEIEHLVKLLKKNKVKNFALLKCNSSYPANFEESNLKTIIDLKKKFKVEIGLSDHTPGIGAAITAVAYGASIIEKHFTLNKKRGGLDDSFSIEPDELNYLVVESYRAWKSKGKVYYGYTKSEKRSKIFKRSIFCNKNIKKGEKFTKENIKLLRPNTGLHPKYYYKILGKKSLSNIKFATPLKKKYIKF